MLPVVDHPHHSVCGRRGRSPRCRHLVFSSPALFQRALEDQFSHSKPPNSRPCCNRRATGIARYGCVGFCLAGLRACTFARRAFGSRSMPCCAQGRGRRRCPFLVALADAPDRTRPYPSSKAQGRVILRPPGRRSRVQNGRRRHRQVRHRDFGAQKSRPRLVKMSPSLTSQEPENSASTSPSRAANPPRTGRGLRRSPEKRQGAGGEIHCTDGNTGPV